MGNLKDGKIIFDGSGDLHSEAKELVAESNMYQYLHGVHEKLPFSPSTCSTSCPIYDHCSSDVSLCATVRTDFATPRVLVHDFEENLIIMPTYSGLQSIFSACKPDSFRSKQNQRFQSQTTGNVLQPLMGA